jgi:hypothetical protein
MIFTNLYVKIWSSNTSVKMNWFENKKWVWILNSNHITLIIQSKLVQDFIQAFTVHSEALLQHCRCYNNTRGVTILVQGLDRELKHTKKTYGRSHNHAYAHSWWRKIEISSLCNELMTPCNGAFTDINCTPSMSMDTMASEHAQSTNKTANENVGTDVESDLTMNNSQKIQFWC